MSGSKGPILAFFITIISVLLLNIILLKNQRYFLKNIIVTVCAFVFFFYLISSIKIAPGRIQQILEVKTIQSSTSYTDREERYINSIELLKNYPMGVGLGNWAHFYNKNRDNKIELTDYPHNIFLEVGVESGWMALITLIVIIFFVTYKIFKFYLLSKGHYTDNIINFNNFLTAIFIFSFINVNISGDLSDARIFFLSMAAILTVFPQKNLNLIQQ